MKKKTKVVIPISLNKDLSNLIKENVTNRSKYIEWLIYQDMKNNNVDGVEKIILQNMGKRLTQEEFIERAKLEHSNRYDYSEVEYIGSKNKIELICRLSGLSSHTLSRL